MVATVKLGTLALRLNPLGRGDLAPMRDLANRLRLPAGSQEYQSLLDEAVGIIFIAARANHPDLRITDLDEATEQEAWAAFFRLAEITSSYWSSEGKHGQ